MFTKKDTAKPESSASTPGFSMARRQRRLLSETAQIEDELLPGYTRWVLYAVLGILVLFLIWASLTRLPEVANGFGEIVPTDRISLVQHLHGGIISEIMVEERQKVQENDVLLKLDDRQATAELRRLESRLAALLLQAERQEAFTQGREPDFTPHELDHPDLVFAQRQALNNQRAVKSSSLEILERQIDQRKSKLEQLAQGLAGAVEHTRLTGGVLQMRKEMLAERLVTRTTYVEAERAYVSARSEEARLRQEITQTRQELAEAQARLTDMKEQLSREPFEQLGRLKSEIAETQEELEKARKVVEDLWVKAPVSGLVFALAMQNRGQVIQPGAVLMKIVPSDAELEAEVRLSPRDVGYVRVGQNVQVKVTSYDYSRFGYVPGRLSRVSAFSSLDEQSQPHFKAWVRLEQPYIEQGQQRYPLLPGMTVNADVVTGEKTLMAYLIDPIIRAFSESFRER
jgi:membrane fusion protein, adhesin transport system